MSTKKLEGCMTALATPFRRGAFDESAYEILIETQIIGGVTVLLPMGTTGESATMSFEERCRAIEVCVKAAKGRVKVFAGAGSNNTQETVDMVKKVRTLGCDGALIVTPFYNKPTQAGVVEHYRAIAKANPGFALMAYNVPGRTGFDMQPETVKRLCEIDEVVAIKEATGSAQRALDIRELCGDRMTVLSGDDFTIAPLMACGARGVVSVSSNVVPRMVTELVQNGLKGDFSKALEVQLKLQALHRLLFIESNPIPVKKALSLMGIFQDEVRLPLTTMTDANALKLRDALVELGVIKRA